MVAIDVRACKKHNRKLLVGWVELDEDEKQLVVFCPAKNCELVVAVQEIQPKSDGYKWYIKKVRVK